MVGKALPRGKSQSHYRYFPGAVYLHDGIYCKASEWVGRGIGGIDRIWLLEEIKELADRYGDHDPFPARPYQLELETLEAIKSNIFPKTFWCTKCGRIVWGENGEGLETALAEAETACKKKDHIFSPNQFRYVAVDRCGFIDEAMYPDANSCPRHGPNNMKLNMHNSERLTNFRIECTMPGCSFQTQIRGTSHLCDSPNLDNDGHNSRSARRGTEDTPIRVQGQIELVTKNIVSLPEIFTRVNLQDGRRLEIKEMAAWEEKVFKAVTESPSLINPDISGHIRRLSAGVPFPYGFDELRQSHPEVAKQIEDIIKKAATGVGNETQYKPDRDTAEEMLDFILAINQPPEGLSRSLAAEAKVSAANPDRREMLSKAEFLGIEDIVLLEQLNLTTVLYGYSRGDYESRNRRLRFFFTREDMRPQSNSIKIYCLPITTEGLVLRFRPERLRDLLDNSHDQKAQKEKGVNSRAEAAAWIARTYKRKERQQLVGFSGSSSQSVSSTLYKTLHTVSHLAMRELGRLIGVEESSIKEMIFPACASVLLYVNQSGDFNLGTFATVFDNYLSNLLGELPKRAEDCLYDPICSLDLDSSCPACLQMGEISCENFNKDLSRKCLVGGNGVVGMWKAESS